MNRLSHLQETLFKNIEDNIGYGNLEFVLLDYNSSDGFEDWVKNNLMEHISTGLVKFYRTTEPSSFHRAHSRNVALRLATGDIVCNLDADNFLGEDFAHFINYKFSFHEAMFLVSGLGNGSYGRVCVKKEDFEQIRGYDEKMSGWGYEDDDLYARLERLDRKKVEFRHATFTRFIEHEIDESFSNDQNILGIKEMYVQYVSAQKSNVLFLFQDGTFNYGTLTKTHEHSEIQLDNFWEKGSYQQSPSKITLNFEASNESQLFHYDHYHHLQAEGQAAFMLPDKVLSDYLKILFTSLQNKKLYKSKEKKLVSNDDTWGNAQLTKNFSEQIIIK